MERVAAPLSRSPMDHGVDGVGRRARHQVLNLYRPAADGSGGHPRFRCGLSWNGVVDGDPRTRSDRRLRSRPPPQLIIPNCGHRIWRSTLALESQSLGLRRVAFGGAALTARPSPCIRAIVEVVLCPSSSGASATRPPRASTK